MLSFTQKRPDMAKPNEDYAAYRAFSDDHGVLIVADGAGGMPGADEASRLSVQSVLDAVDRADSEGTLRSSILDGFEKANLKVMELGIGAATTLVVVEILHDFIRTYHVGDSAAWVIGGRGKMKCQTVPHSPVGHAQYSGLIGEEEAMEHEDRHIVNNMVGNTEMSVEIGSAIKMATRDTVIVASDGLFDNLYEFEIVNLLRKGTLKDIGNRLAENCTQRMNEPENNQPSKPDDLTFILYRLHA